MLYFLSPCAATTSKWLGDVQHYIPEIATIISTSVQMIATESHPHLARANENIYPHFWMWCTESAFNLEWMLSLYECEIEKSNRYKLMQLPSSTLVNAVREYQHLFPRTEFTYPLNPETERQRFASDCRGRKLYRKIAPPFWLTNHQVVVGLDTEPEDLT